jgi:hypothetical protein
MIDSETNIASPDSQTIDSEKFLTLRPGVDEFLDFASLKSSCTNGLRQVTLAGLSLEMPLNRQEAYLFLDCIRFIRDCTGFGIAVDWHAGDSLRDIAAMIYHLAPCNGDSAMASAWRDAHHYGMFYFRNGDEFTVVTDRRQPKFGNQFILDTPGYVSTFRAASTVLDRTLLERIDREALADLEQEGIILSLFDYSVALPFHMQHFPVPFNAV